MFWRFNPRGRGRSGRLLAGTRCGLLVGVLAGPTLTLAHAYLQRADPEPGSTLARPIPADAASLDRGQAIYAQAGLVTSGVPGTAMPAFGDRLPEQERWDVINYIRTFAVANAPN